MFFGENEIDRILECPCCNELFDEPRMLPCGHTFCKLCLLNLTSRVVGGNNSLECSTCTTVHEIPEKGFPVNRVLLNMLAVEPRQVYRSKAVETLNDYLDDICERQAKLNEIMDKPNETIEEQCDEIDEAVQESYEKIVEKINASHAAFKREIADFKAKCLSKSSLVIAQERASIEKELGKMTSFVADWREYLSEFTLDDNQVASATNSANKLRSELGAMQQRLKLHLNTYVELSFKENKSVQNSQDIFGRLNFERKLIGLVVADFSLKKKLHLQNLATASSTNVTQYSSFVHVMASQRKPSRFLVLYQIGRSVYLHWSDRETRINVWSDNGGYDLAASNVLYSHFDGDTFVYLKFAGKATLKLFNSELSNVKKLKTTAHTTFSRVTMNSTRIFATSGQDSIVVFDKNVIELDTHKWTHPIRCMSATNEHVFLLDSQDMISILKCADFLCVRTFAANLPSSPKQFCIHLSSLLIFYIRTQPDKLFAFDLHGTKFEETLTNRPTDSNISLVGESADRLVFFDTTSSIVYY